ncbi:MAG: hypothetical protein IT529_22605 [Burkholderiales bacterium]|nr:hypothetical protein [Burkholderiales bacterium]
MRPGSPAMTAGENSTDRGPGPWARARSFLAAARPMGWKDGCLFAASALLRRLSSGRWALYKYYFVAQPVSDRPLLPARRGTTLEVREIPGDDPLVRAFPRPRRVIEERFRQGAVCLAALERDAFVGFIWFVTGPYREDEVRCRYVPLPEGSRAWDFDIYLVESHRNGIAFLKLWDAANRYLAARGVVSSLSRISAFNTASLLSHYRMGARRVGAALFLVIGSWQLARSSVAPRWHFSRRPESFPDYRFEPPAP